MKKTVALNLRITEKERNALHANALLADVPASEFVRIAIKLIDPAVVKEYSER